jgi:glycosyltransferase involved in cell wall biosynthesis
MKIAIDVTSTETNPAGIGQYTKNLIDTLLTQDQENEYVLYSNKPYPTQNPKHSNKIIKPNKLLPFKGVSWMLKVAGDAKRNNVDVLISPANFLFARLFPKTIQFVYDLSPIKYPQFFSKKASLFYKFLVKFAVPKAYRIVTISGTAKNEVIEYTKLASEKIFVIYPSFNAKLENEAVEFVDLGLPDKYILSVSTLEPRKNIILALAGFKRLLTDPKYHDLKFVIVGKKGWFYQETLAKVEQLELSNQVIFMGYVDDKYLATIHKKSLASIYLSEYEGFGMPILEALHFGKPAVVNNIAVFKECFGESAIFVDAKDADSVATGIKQALEDSNKKPFDDNHFTWQKSASELLKIVNNC